MSESLCLDFIESLSDFSFFYRRVVADIRYVSEARVRQYRFYRREQRVARTISEKLRPRTGI